MAEPAAGGHERRVGAHRPPRLAGRHPARAGAALPLRR